MEAAAQAQQDIPSNAGTSAVTETPAEHNVFPPFDATTFASQLLWLAITFAVLYYLMARVAVPRIAGIIEDRRDRIASDLDMADRLKTDSEEALAAYEKALAEARAKAFAIAETAREEARASVEARRAEVEAGLNKKLAAAETRIAEIKQAALADVGAIAGEATQAIVKSLIDADVAADEVGEAVSGAMSR
jgi:F-type H+-transporting ATPase subunit b